MLTMSCDTRHAGIYYTLDGTEPTRMSNRYMSPFRVKPRKTVKAFAVKEDYIDSDVTSFTVPGGNPVIDFIRIHWLWIAALAVVAIIAAVLYKGLSGLSYEDNDSILISKAQRDSIIQSREFFAGLNMDLQEELYNILWEMDEIAGETFELERQREREGGIEDRVAVRIQKRIASVRAQIENAERLAENRPQLKSMFTQLRHSLLDKDKELERLKTNLNQKKSTLQEKYDELESIKSDLEIKISVLETDRTGLERAEAALSNSKVTAWSKAGNKLMESLDYIEITKKRGKGKEVREAKIRIAERAVSCFEKAKDMGDMSVDEKIRKLNTIIQRLRNGENV